MELWSGTGTFFYAAGAISRPGVYRRTIAVFLWDRITVRRVSVRNGVIVVGYLNRRPSEPMAAIPMESKSVYLTVVSSKLATIGPLAEGGISWRDE